MNNKQKLFYGIGVVFSSYVAGTFLKGFALSLLDRTLKDERRRVIYDPRSRGGYSPYDFSRRKKEANEKADKES